MNLKDCHNFSDFRKLAKKKLPSPIFHYIDGAADDLKLKQVNELLKGHLVKRKIDPRIFDIQTAVEATGASKRQIIKIKEGISQDSAKKIISEVKKTKIKVQIKIQGNELRADGKKKDDLQEAMQLIKGVNIGQPVEFTNFRD